MQLPSGNHARGAIPAGPDQRHSRTAAQTPRRLPDARSSGGRTQRAQHYPPPRNIFIPASAATGGGDAGAAVMSDAAPEPAFDAGAVSEQVSSSMQYLGFVDVDPAGPRGNVGVVVIGDELHMVRAGEHIGGQFVVKAVTAEALIAIERATGREVHFPLSDMAPMEPAS